MNAKELATKYGVWIAAGVLVLYLVYRQMRGGTTARPLIGPAPPGAAGFSADQYRLESERLRAAGALDLERLRLDAAREAALRKAENDRYNLEQQIAARNRALQLAERGQTLGLIGNIANSIAGLFKGQQAQQSKPTGTTPPISGGSSGGGIGRTQPQLPPYYPIPEPNINVLYDPSYMPAFPEPAPEYMQLRIDDWGEAPQFQTSGTDLDSGVTFFDQYAFGGDDFNYGYGFDEAYSSLPSLGQDYGETAGYEYGYDYNQAFNQFDFAPQGDYYDYYGGGGGSYDTTGTAYEFDFGGGGYYDYYPEDYYA